MKNVDSRSSGQNRERSTEANIGGCRCRERTGRPFRCAYFGRRQTMKCPCTQNCPRRVRERDKMRKEGRIR